MKEALIRKILSERLEEIYRHCKNVDKKFDKETIHTFRLSVKTFRSFLHLLSAVNKNVKIKLPKSIKRLYRVSGVVREAQIEADLMKLKGIEIPGYDLHLEHVFMIQKAEWARCYHKSKKANTDKFLKKVSISTFPPDAVSGFFSSRMTAIGKTVKAKRISNDHIHEVRKQLKDMVYLTGILKKHWKTGLKKNNPLPDTLLTKLSARIGDYNDQRIMLEHFFSYYFEQKPSLKKLIKPVLNQMGLEQVELKKVLIADMKQFVASSFN